MGLKNDRVLRRIISQIALKYDLKHSLVADLINEQFNYVHKIIARGEFETVRMPYLGKFKASLWAIQRVVKGSLRKAKERYRRNGTIHTD